MTSATSLSCCSSPALVHTVQGRFSRDQLLLPGAGLSHQLLPRVVLELGLLGVHADCLLSRVRIIRSNQLDRQLPGGQEGDQDRLHLLHPGRKVLFSAFRSLSKSYPISLRNATSLSLLLKTYSLFMISCQFLDTSSSRVTSALN